MHQIFQDSLLFYTASAILGLVFGSFATALIYRLPREENWVSKRSACPKCKTKLRIPDLFPVLSYIISGGKCRYCGVKFGCFYLIIELLHLSTFLIVAYMFGPSLKGLILMLLAFFLIVLSAIDFEHYIIPDEINIGIVLLGISYQIFSGPNIVNLLYMPLFCLGFSLFLRYLMYFWKKREGLGLGDVKFFLAVGFFLEPLSFPAFLLLSGLSGVMIAIIWRLLKKGELFPFGPALAAALFLCFAFPEIGTLFVNYSNNLLL